jgi:hypothetical protein
MHLRGNYTYGLALGNTTSLGSYRGSEASATSSTRRIENAGTCKTRGFARL